MPDWPLLWTLHYFLPLLLPQPERCCPCDTRLIIKSVQVALVHFQTEHIESCPRSLDALVKDKYLSRTPLDAWGHPLQFICPGTHDPDGVDVISAGPDGEFGDGDDIRSWAMMAP